MSICLDSWAVIAWLDGEPPRAADVVGKALRSQPTMSWVNAIEVSYHVERLDGRAAAHRTLAAMRGRIRLELPDEARMLDVARVQARHAIALADCFAIATAAAHDAVLWTGDPEILRARGLPCRTRDLRPRPRRRR